MYTVGIYRFRDGLLLDSKTFQYGHWHMIGYWLDDNGYIDAEYKVEVTFNEND